MTNVQGIVDDLVDGRSTDDSIGTTASKPCRGLVRPQRFQMRRASLVMVNDASRTRKVETLCQRQRDQVVADDNRVRYDGDSEGNNREK